MELPLRKEQGRTDKQGKGKAADFLENIARIPRLADMLARGDELANLVPQLET